jgi:hypothetical protein
MSQCRKKANFRNEGKEVGEGNECANNHDCALVWCRQARLTIINPIHN